MRWGMVGDAPLGWWDSRSLVKKSRSHKHICDGNFWGSSLPWVRLERWFAFKNLWDIAVVCKGKFTVLRQWTVCSWSDCHSPFPLGLVSLGGSQEGSLRPWRLDLSMQRQGWYPAQTCNSGQGRPGSFCNWSSEVEIHQTNPSLTLVFSHRWPSSFFL